MADPAPNELATMLTMVDTFKWAGFGDDDLSSDKTTGGTLALLLGVKPDDHPRVMSMVEDSELTVILGKWKVAETAADGTVSYRPPNLAELGKAKLMVRACKLVGGRGKTLEDLQKQIAAASQAPQQPQPQAPPVSTAADRKFKLSAILSQVDETEAKVMTEKELVAAYLRYSTVFGDNERPSKESEPTVEQLSAVRRLIDQHNAPYCDFSIWGPYAHRLAKKIKLSGYVIGRDGVLTSVELTGPTSFGMWLQSWQVFSNVCVMLDIIDLGTLTKHRELIEKFHNRYGQAIWALLYQADVRCRLELAERIHRQIQAEQEALVKSHGSASGTPPKVPGYDPSRPWNLVYQRAINDETYWREEVVEPSLLVLTKVSGISDVTDGDAKVRQDAASHHAASPREVGVTPSRMNAGHPSASAPKVRPRNTNRTGRHHSVQDGKYTANRTGYLLCGGAYNEGRCEGAQPGGWCPQNWDTVHQCSKCLGQHPASRCPHESMPQPNFLKNRGKGRGGGKGGRKGKGKGAHY